MKSFYKSLSDEQVLSLVRRMELEPKLLRRHFEEQIVEVEHNYYVEKNSVSCCPDADLSISSFFFFSAMTRSGRI